MRFANSCLSVFLGSCLACLAPLPASPQEPPTGGLYEITSGTFLECCGIAGPISHSLPSDSQRFIHLQIDGQRATMTILGRNLETLTRNVTCGSIESVRFSFANGFVSSGFSNIVFHADPGPFPNSQFVNYSLRLSKDALILNGTAGINNVLCADIPKEFTHSEVTAVRLARASLRVSEYEVCWASYSNRLYQVQYFSSATSNAWKNLGTPVMGNGLTNCITDRVEPGEPKRQYRLVIGR